MRAEPIDTDLGAFMARFSPRGLARLDFPSKRRRPGIADRSGPAAETRVREDWIGLTRNALAAVLAGQKPKAFPPLDWSEATEFQRRVWRALRRIPPGQTRTYAQVASALGKAGAARAVGNACGANPIPLLVPCHRVTAAGGGLGGFSGGLRWKRRLLEIEGVTQLRTA